MSNFRITTSFFLILTVFSLNGRSYAVDKDSPFPRIEAFEVIAAGDLAAGEILHFSVFGSSHGQAKAMLAGGHRALSMHETDSGHYQGDYWIAPLDRITQRSRVTIVLRSKRGMASVKLEDILMSSNSDVNRPLSSAPSPVINLLQISPSGVPISGSQLMFTLKGTPGGMAFITIGGLGPTVLLSEMNGSGQYVGTYTLRAHDEVTALSLVSAALRVDDQVARVGFGRFFQQRTAPMPLMGNSFQPAEIAPTQGTHVPHFEMINAQ